MLSGKIHCSECGRAMSGHRIRLRGKLYVRYECKCGSIQRDFIESIAVQSIRKLFDTETEQHIIEEAKRLHAEATKNKDKVEAFKAAIRQSASALNNLYKLVEAGIMDTSTIERIRTQTAQVELLKERKRQI